MLVASLYKGFFSPGNGLFIAQVVRQNSIDKEAFASP
jgi:hypothetical protein